VTGIVIHGSGQSHREQTISRSTVGSGRNCKAASEIVRAGKHALSGVQTIDDLAQAVRDSLLNSYGTGRHISIALRKKGPADVF
jgi:hypothetical protein